MNKRLNTAFEEFQATMAAQFIIGGSMGCPFDLAHSLFVAHL